MYRNVLRPIRAAVFAVAAAVLAGCAAGVPHACPPGGAWVEPGTDRRLDHAALIGRLARRPAVLLGESHAVAAHHRWELAVIAALYGRRSNMVLGFEAFPRRVQPVLDRWVRGELDQKAFLAAVDWPAVWGYPAAYYMPMFEFARLFRIPMVALNVDQALVRRVRREGWRDIPPADRSGLGEPAPPGPAYRRRLAEAFARHPPGTRPSGAPTDVDAVQRLPAFERFVEAQLTWDRAMAEAIVAAHARPGAPLVVAVMGHGHVANRQGVPHQLAALGLRDAAALLPRNRDAACKGLPAGLADAVFVLGHNEETAGARLVLGVRLEDAAGRVRIVAVAPGSVAAAAGLRTGDVIRQAAGQPMTRPADLVAVIRRQAPGTWLPLRIDRNGRVRRIVAKFP